MNQSEHYFKQAKQVIPGGVDSPVRAFKGVGGCPKFIERAEGAYLFDVDGKRYIDYVGSWGPMIAGHAHPRVVEALQAQAAKGVSYGASSPLETTLAEKVRELMPSMEKVRFVNSGTEATMTAIRLARGVMGRNKIIKFQGCYHGHADCLLVKAGSGVLTLGIPGSPGVPADTTKHTLTADFNDLDSVKQQFEAYPDDIACIILEPIAGNMNFVRPTNGFLQGLRKLCDQYGALLVIDEVMTGFRVALGGAQSVYQVTPDITCLGKVIGGGMPVGALGGRADVMDHLAPDGPVYQAGTLSGNPMAMVAGFETLSIISEPGFFETLAAKTQRLVTGLQAVADKANLPFYADSEGGMFGLFFTDQAPVTNFEQVQQGDNDRFKRYFHAMLDHGVYLAPSMYEAGFVSQAHTEADIDQTIACSEAFFNAE